jgi:hypothetical protein
MMRMGGQQMAAMARERFFARVSAFILEQSTHTAYRTLAADARRRRLLWEPEWPALAGQPERDAAMFLCFVLACAVLGIDLAHGSRVARGAPDLGFSMRTFLCEHGLLRFSAFDVPELTRPQAS